MKSIKYIILALTFLLLLGNSGCQTKEKPIKIENPADTTKTDSIVLSGYYDQEQDIYVFTDSWKQCANMSDAEKACQIPEDILAIISTKGLLETSLEYPFFMSIFAYNDYQTGFNWILSRFNGYRELLKRPDLINVLIEKYTTFKDKVPIIRLQSDLSLAYFSYQHFLLVMILAQDVVVENLSEKQEKTLILLSFENNEMIINNLDVFSGLNFIPAFLIYSKLAINDPEFEFESTELKKAVLYFIEKPHHLSEQTAYYIEKYIYEKYKQ